MDQEFYELMNKLNEIERSNSNTQLLLGQMLQLANMQSMAINALNESITKLQYQVQDLSVNGDSGEIDLDEVKTLQGVIIEELHALQDIIINLEAPRYRSSSTQYNSTSST